MGAHWQRHDGFDPRDPSAPAVFMCTGCDASRDKATAFCPSCNEVTGSYPGIGRAVGGPYQSTRPVATMGFVRERTGLIHLGEAA
jgi:hypothetical protein